MPARLGSFTLHGSFATRCTGLFLLVRSFLVVLGRRILRGPLRPSWPLELEVATRFFKAQDAVALKLAADDKVGEIRRVIDALVFRLPALDRVHKAPEQEIPGAWFAAGRAGPTTLYFHGGGYSFYPAMTDNIVAVVTLAAGGRTFVPWYRLAPEHPYPCQLDDALRAYRWLLDAGTAPSQLVLAGDSAGGHLVLVLLLALKAAGLPMPAAAVAISPWTDPRNAGASMVTNRRFDWMSPQMSDHLARWAGPEFVRSGPLDSQNPHDLKGLPPLLVHAGEVEICRDMIEAFCANARRAGADVSYRCFPDMTHDFHGFGDLLPQSREALDDIRTFVAARAAPR
jgi:acetyl esterase/lipase